LKKNTEVRTAHIIAAYHPFPSEVDLQPLYTYLRAEGRILAFPVWQKNFHDMDFYSLDTLIDTAKIDLILVPGIAFDVNGNRIGFGKGYYDTFLKRISKHATVLGICFQFQVREKVPHTEWDVPVHTVITEGT